ncbi:MAG: Uma2 family endonuclease [Pyrinomonadaceae bacterium]|nr:Uma2 family endonuclease [Pyrinomonadaceae bacterium]
MIENLCKIKQKAELVNGEIIFIPPTGDEPNRAGGSIYVSLRQHEKKIKKGRSFTDNTGFKVNLPNRQSFSPDVAFHIGESAGMKFVEGAPVFAVEVRSEGDYGKYAEAQMKQKREDYFNAGTLVVWDVDLLSEDVIRVYRAENPDQPTIYQRGEIAEAEPAVPDWQMPVDDLFD